jgi:HD-like signal output (HDOD) protein
MPQSLDTSTSPCVATSIDAALAEFTRRLGVELAAETPELPSFPEVAVRVRKALSDDRVSVDAVVRIVSAEPSLAVRLLQLANSVALNPAGQRVTTLRAAVSRIGFNMARSVTMAFAMSQMRRADAWRGLEARFGEIWSDCARLAATSHALAQRCGRPDAEEALLAGMLHSVGKLFVLTRLGKFPALLASPAVRWEMQSAWHARAARALLARWDLAPEVLEAACELERPAGSGAPRLRDVLHAARQLITLQGADDITRGAVLAGPVFARLGFDVHGAGRLLEDSAAEVESLRAALAD